MKICIKFAFPRVKANNNRATVVFASGGDKLLPVENTPVGSILMVVSIPYSDLLTASLE